jgi:hypothetical protein
MTYPVITACEFLGLPDIHEPEDLSEFQNLNLIFKDEEYDSHN